MQYNISYWCVSNIGKIRRMNQDNFICNGRFMEINDEIIQFPLTGVKSSKARSVFGIFDGMGGEESGEVAAYIAAKCASDLTIGKNVLSDLSQFCQNANAKICEYAKEHGVICMGTTAAMLSFTNKNITLCNIGDSKIFRFSNGSLSQISEDHVAATVFGRKAPLSQHLGIPPTELLIEPYLAQGIYQDNDIYLICSDGLTDMVTTEEMSEVLANTSADEIVNTLLKKALLNGGRDNITIILCKINRKPHWIWKLIKRKVQEG